jgi:hypothetical protein
VQPGKEFQRICRALGYFAITEHAALCAAVMSWQVEDVGSPQGDAPPPVNLAKDCPSPRGSVTSAATTAATASTTAAATDTTAGDTAAAAGGTSDAAAGVVDSLRRDAATGDDDAKLQLAQKCTAPAFKVRSASCCT